MENVRNEVVNGRSCVISWSCIACVVVDNVVSSFNKPGRNVRADLERGVRAELARRVDDGLLEGL